MLAAEIISDSIPPLKPTDTGIMVINWMDEFRVTHLPVVSGRKYLGLVSEMDILDNELSDEEIKRIVPKLPRPCIAGHQHIYEVIKLISGMKLSLLPVVDEDDNYLGLIPAIDLIHHFSTLAASQEPGSVIVLELNQNDFSLQQIAQIVEGNDARILSFYVHPVPDSTRLELTMKINREDLAGIVQTFERYNYSVKASFYRSLYLDDMKQRYETFMKFLNL